MCHVMIMEAVKGWPPHWQKVFEEMSLSLGKVGAYQAIKKLKGENIYA